MTLMMMLMTTTGSLYVSHAKQGTKQENPQEGISNKYWHFPVERRELSPDIPIALVKALFSIQKYWYFSYFSTKSYVVGTH